MSYYHYHVLDIQQSHYVPGLLNPRMWWPLAQKAARMLPHAAPQEVPTWQSQLYYGISWMMKEVLLHCYLPVPPCSHKHIQQTIFSLFHSPRTCQALYAGAGVSAREYILWWPAKTSHNPQCQQWRSSWPNQCFWDGYSFEGTEQKGAYPQPRCVNLESAIPPSHLRMHVTPTKKAPLEMVKAIGTWKQCIEQEIASGMKHSPPMLAYLIQEQNLYHCWWLEYKHRTGLQVCHSKWLARNVNWCVLQTRVKSDVPMTSALVSDA